MARAKRFYLENRKNPEAKEIFTRIFHAPCVDFTQLIYFPPGNYFTVADDNLWLASPFDGRV
jgi:hypothetical protein